MTDPSRLIVVSNRLPVSLVKEENEWRAKRSSGGLATAMDPILKKAGGLWIGWSGSRGDETPDVLKTLREDQSCVAVALPADILEKFYEGYANQALWPLFHSFSSKLHFDAESWEAYKVANQLFCDAVLAEFRPGDRIWVHDYHLMLLPSLLREKLPDAAIGYFLHIPFPASDVFSILPRGEELLEGLLGADLISFHTHLHLQHFRMCLRRLLGIESALDRLDLSGREVRLQALPIGIAPADFLDVKDQPETLEELAKLRERYKGCQVIVAVDRLDYTKGIPDRLRTFRRLLQNNPELSGKVVLLQVAVPSRENIGAYQDLRNEVHELISATNGDFGSSDWVPIVYIHRGIPRHELVAIYQLADVAWVSPLRDGMNLVAKEYVVCHPEGDGVLVLSSFAGAAPEMGEALLINPFDEERTALSVQRGPEDGGRGKALSNARPPQESAKKRRIRLGERFLALLDEAAKDRSDALPDTPPRVPMDQITAAYRKSSRRLLLLDYDGTLVPFASRPYDAAPDNDLGALLHQLASDPANSVFVVSGRRAADLERWLGQIPGLGLAPEHGARWRLPGSDTWQGRTAEAEWKAGVRPILEHFVDRTPGSFIEEKELALVWHYRYAEAEFSDWLATELVAMLEGMLAETELRASRGKKIVEVKPMWANKGGLVNEVLPLYPDATFVLGIGDDRTDEDLFSRLPDDAWSIHVGSGASKARFSISEVAQVRKLLLLLSTPVSANSAPSTAKNVPAVEINEKTFAKEG